MRDQGSRRGAANLSIPLMVLAFGLIAGFLWWLSQNAESTEVVVDELPTSTPAPNAGGAATDVTADQLRLEPATFTGQRVRVADVPVASAVGTQAFFLDLPQTPFLVKLSSELVARGEQVPTGAVTVVGTLTAMNDSIVGDWAGSGAISEGDRILVEFATHFIEANVVTPAGGASGPPAP